MKKLLSGICKVLASVAFVAALSIQTPDGGVSFISIILLGLFLILSLFMDKKGMLNDSNEA